MYKIISYVDITVTIRGQSIPNVSGIEGVGPFFKAALASGMQESYSRAIEIDLEDLSILYGDFFQSTVASFLHYLKFLERDPVCVSQFLKLMLLADAYLVDGLFDECKQTLLDSFQKPEIIASFLVSMVEARGLVVTDQIRAHLYSIFNHEELVVTLEEGLLLDTILDLAKQDVFLNKLESCGVLEIPAPCIIKAIFGDAKVEDEGITIRDISSTALGLVSASVALRHYSQIGYYAQGSVSLVLNSFFLYVAQSLSVVISPPLFLPAIFDGVYNPFFINANIMKGSLSCWLHNTPDCMAVVAEKMGVIHDFSNFGDGVLACSFFTLNSLVENWFVAPVINVAGTALFGLSLFTLGGCIGDGLTSLMTSVFSSRGRLESRDAARLERQKYLLESACSKLEGGVLS